MRATLLVLTLLNVISPGRASARNLEDSGPAGPAPPAHAAPVAATAESCVPCAQRGSSRTLGGHNFVPMELVAWPFIATYFGFGLGGGVMQLNGVGMSSSGASMVGQTVDLAVLRQRIEVGLGLFDWVAVRGHFAGTMISGASLDELLGFGASFSYEVGGGAQVRILKLSRFLLSVGADFEHSRGKLITPGLAVERAIATADLDEAGKVLFNDLATTSFTPVLAAAIAPASAIGLQTSFGVAIGGDEVNGESSSTTGIEWGIGVTLDLRPIQVPLALPFAYELSKTFGDRGESQHMIEFGAFYSGRSNLDLGLAFQTRLDEGTEQSEMFLGLLRMNYIW